MTTIKSKLNKDLLLHNLNQFKAYLFVFFAFGFASYPLQVIIFKGQTFLQDYANKRHFTNTGLLVAVMFMALISPFIFFSYLNSKKAVDVYHALPIKKSDLLLTQRISSLLLILIPFTLNYFLGFALNKSFGLSIPNIELAYYFFYVIAISAVHETMLIILMNTGTTSDNMLYAAIIFILPFIAYFAMNTFIYSYISTLSSIDNDILAYVSPLYALYLPHYNTYNQFIFNVASYWVLMLALVYLLLNKIYEARKSENSGEPFANERFYPFIMTLFTPILFLLFNGSFSSWENRGLSAFFKMEAFLLPVILTFVIYSLLGFVRYRSTRFFIKSTARFILIILVTTILSVLTIKTHVFGFALRLPSVNEVQSVELNMTQLSYSHPLFALNNNYSERLVSITQKEAISSILETHHHVNDLLKDNDFDYEKLVFGSSMGEVLFDVEDWNELHLMSLQYTLKNGKVINREFQIPVELIFDFAHIIQTHEFQKGTQPILNEIQNIADVYLYNDVQSEVLRIDNTKEFKENLTNAYLKDLDNMSLDNYLYQTSDLKYMVKYNFDTLEEFASDRYEPYKNTWTYYLLVDSRFVHTLRYLEQFELKENQNQPYSTIIEYAGSNTVYFYGSAYTQPDVYDEAHTPLRIISGQVQGSHISKSRNNYALSLDNAIILPLKPDFKP